MMAWLTFSLCRILQQLQRNVPTDYDWHLMLSSLTNICCTLWSRFIPKFEAGNTFRAAKCGNYSQVLITEIFFKFYLFIYLWLCWVFVSARGLYLVAASGGHSSSRCAGLSLSRPLLLRSAGSRRAGSAIVAQGPSCSAACGIFPDQGSNPCPLHWQADSQPLRHQGSPP